MRWPAAWLPKEDDGTNNPPEGCNGGSWDPPPPGDGFQEPMSRCKKQNFDLVCPSSGGGSFGGTPKQLQDLTLECPEN